MAYVLDLSPSQLEAWVRERGFPKFRTDQILDWIYKKNENDPQRMSNLPAGLRQELALNMGPPPAREKDRASSSDGAVKILHELRGGALVESVYMPEKDRASLCVSTQSGCRMACRFCATGAVGFTRDLSPSEIVGQVLAARAMDPRINSIVLMGMGEPLDNLENVLAALEILADPRALSFPAKSIVVSTVGLPEGITALADSGLGVGVALSLHSALAPTREYLVPAAKKHGLNEIKKALKDYPLPGKEKITLEITLIGGVNDSADEAMAVAKWAHDLPVRINLIRFNPSPDINLRAPSEEAVLAYQAALRDKGFLAFIRRPRGRDVMAACGQLRARAMKE